MNSSGTKCLYTKSVYVSRVYLYIWALILPNMVQFVNNLPPRDNNNKSLGIRPHYPQELVTRGPSLWWHCIALSLFLYLVWSHSFPDGYKENEHNLEASLHNIILLLTGKLIVFFLITIHYTNTINIFKQISVHQALNLVQILHVKKCCKLQIFCNKVVDTYWP